MGRETPDAGAARDLRLLSDALGVVAAILVAGMANAIVFPIVALAFGRFVRVPLTKAAIGVGPRLFSFDVRGTKVEIRLLPVQSYVVPLGGNPYADDPDPEPPWVSWLDASRWRRVLVYVLAPRVVFFGIALVVLGPERALRAVVRGFSEVFAAFGGSRAVLDRAAQVLAREGLVLLAALAICKATAASVLALPTDLLYACSSRGSDEGNSRLKTEAKIRAVFLLVTVALAALWVIAWARWAFA